MSDMASKLLATCIAAKHDGADFPTVWQTILREFILGGVTRGILKSMPVPVLMSH